jgi:hypothetical protein
MQPVLEAKNARKKNCAAAVLSLEGAIEPIKPGHHSKMDGLKDPYGLIAIANGDRQTRVRAFCEGRGPLHGGVS